MSIYEDIGNRQHLELEQRDWQILGRAKELDARFKAQFQRRTFDYVHPKEHLLDYLPPILHKDTQLVRDHVTHISYTHWPAKKPSRNTKTLIALCGIYDPARAFDFFAEQASNHANIICLDYPGKGESGNLRLPHDYSLSTYAKVVQALVEHLDPVQPFSILGHSHGAKVIYTMAEQGFTHPKWESTIIGDMAPETPEGPKARRAWRNLETPTYESVGRGVDALKKFISGHGALPDDIYINMFNHGFQFDSRTRGYRWSYDPASMAGYCHEYATMPYDKWNAYRNMLVPVMILAGENSNTLEATTLDRMLEERPDASMMLFRNTGHYPNLFLPDHIEHVMGWINKQNPNADIAPTRLVIPASDDPNRTAAPWLHLVPMRRAANDSGAAPTFRQSSRHTLNRE